MSSDQRDSHLNQLNDKPKKKKNQTIFHDKNTYVHKQKIKLNKNKWEEKLVEKKQFYRTLIKE